MRASDLSGLVRRGVSRSHATAPCRAQDPDGATSSVNRHCQAAARLGNPLLSATPPDKRHIGRGLAHMAAQTFDPISKDQPHRRHPAENRADLIGRGFVLPKQQDSSPFGHAFIRTAGGGVIAFVGHTLAAWAMSSGSRVKSSNTFLTAARSRGKHLFLGNHGFFLSQTGIAPTDG